MECLFPLLATAHLFFFALLLHCPLVYAVDFGGGFYSSGALGSYHLEGVPSVGISPQTTKLGLTLALDSKHGTEQQFVYRSGVTLGLWSLDDQRANGFRGNGYGIGLDQTFAYTFSTFRSYRLYAGPSVNLSIGRMHDELDTVILATGGAGPTLGFKFNNSWNSTTYSLAMSYILAYAILDWNSGVFSHQGTDHAISLNATVFFAGKKQRTP